MPSQELACYIEDQYRRSEIQLPWTHIVVVVVANSLISSVLVDKVTVIQDDTALATSKYVVVHKSFVLLAAAVVKGVSHIYQVHPQA